MKRKFAVFDIDGTIARTALFFQIVDELLERGVLPEQSRVELDILYDNYRRRTHKDAFRIFSLKSVDVLFHNITTIQAAEYRRAVDKIAPKTANYVYVYTRDLIKKLKDQDYFLIALSGSEMYSVQQFSEHFGFDLAVGELYHEKDGYFTGQIEEVIHRKDAFIKKFITEYNLTIEGSYAVGDSIGDLGMLELVEHPIAFNPEDQLFEKAKAMGWDIVIERKNVTYELRMVNGQYLLA